MRKGIIWNYGIMYGGKFKMYFGETQGYPEDATRSNGKKCIPQETVIYNVNLAKAYVPFQKFCTIYSPMEGLKKGTIFPELYSPYDNLKKKMIIASRIPEESYENGL